MLRKFSETILFLLFSTFIASLLLFSLFEFRPELPKKLGLNALPYYALKERYVLDPVLIFRMRPFFEYQGIFHGDIVGLHLSNDSKPAPAYSAKYDIQGFRNTTLTDPPKISVLGDSFVEFGLHEEDTFPARLQKELKQSVANYGLGWYGPSQYLSVFKKFVLPLKPEVVLFCFFEGNDMRDIKEYLRWENGSSYYQFNLGDSNFIRKYVASMENALRFIAKLFLRRFDPRNAQIELGDQKFSTTFVYPANSESYEDLDGSKEMTELRAILSEFKALAISNNIRPVFIFIPSKSRIYLPYSSQKDSDERHAIDDLEEVIREVNSDIGLDYFSLTPAFQQMAAKHELVFYMNDTHWNENGRDIAASEIASFLYPGSILSKE